MAEAFIPDNQQSIAYNQQHALHSRAMGSLRKGLMKILVTGGAGFIASHISDAYLQAGHEVVIVDNLSSGKQANLNPQAKFIEADITDEAKITEIIQTERPEVINHHAAHIQVGYSVSHPQFDAQNNIIGLLNIMQAAKRWE